MEEGGNGCEPVPPFFYFCVRCISQSMLVLELVSMCRLSRSFQRLAQFTKALTVPYARFDGMLKHRDREWRPFFSYYFFAPFSMEAICRDGKWPIKLAPAQAVKKAKIPPRCNQSHITRPSRLICQKTNRPTSRQTSASTQLH